MLNIDINIEPQNEVGMSLIDTAEQLSFVIDDTVIVVRDHAILDNRNLPDQHSISAITGLADELGNISSSIPTRTSQLLNDSGFINAGDIPSKTSDLINDSGFVTSADIPSKTSQLTNDSGFLTGGDVVLSVNGMRGSVVLEAVDVGALPSSTVIPDKTSQLQNDSGFITGINSTQVINALGYTPYSSANPDGFISSYTETDPTVPSWAKASSKPSYTASEVGAISTNAIVTSLSSSSTNSQVPSAKCVYDIIGDVESLLASI